MNASEDYEKQERAELEAMPDYLRLNKRRQKEQEKLNLHIRRVLAKTEVEVA